MKQVKEKGRGVFSTRHFKKGEMVGEYLGELISYEEAKRRENYSTDPCIGCFIYLSSRMRDCGKFKRQNFHIPLLYLLSLLLYSIDATEENGTNGL